MTGPISEDLPVLPAVTVHEEDRLEHRRGLVQDLVTSVSVVVAWFTAAGLLGALLWVTVTPLPGFTRIAESGTMDEEQLAKQFSSSGWFLVIAVVGGLLSGLALMLLRRTSPPAVLVVLLALGGGLATLLMVQCGLAWGPDDPNAALATAPVGDVVPIQLKADAHGVYYAWSVAALLGAGLMLWGAESRANRRARRADHPVPVEQF
ncbi:MAG: hypothetical protein NTV23_15070 [Propionibacteriales bacterium]|nr:hypothetical protein [Propionibacteriales bacterium]